MSHTSRNIESSSQYKKRIYPYGYELTFSLQAPRTSESAVLLCDGILNQVLPPTSQSTDLKDVKGGKDNKLLHLSLLLPIAASLEQEELSFNISTDFKSFEGLHHIVHSVRETRSDSKLSFLPLRHAARVAPLTISKLRFQGETFQSKLHTRLLGFKPVITESFSIEVAQNSLCIDIRSDSLPSNKTLPLKSHKILTRLDELTQEHLAFSLISSIQDSS